MGKSRKSKLALIVVALLLLAITFMETWMVFRQTSRQTRESGIYQLESISGELEGTINDAEKLTLEQALAVEEYLGDRDELQEYIYAQKAELLSAGTGVFNFYIAGSDWLIIPDFDAPDDYVTTERVWYIGALKNKGRTYVSSPYQDAMTGNICYTVSVMLDDGDTVVALDYTMETIQNHIWQLYGSDPHSTNAIIVTDEGIIAGCSDASLIGERLMNALPDYTGIWTRAKNTEGVASSRIKSEFLYENLFAAEAGNGWYLIISENDWDLYRNSYMQLLIMIVLFLLLFVVIIIFYRLGLQKKDPEEKQRLHRAGKLNSQKVNQRYRFMILIFMVLVMIFSLYTNLSVTYNWGNERMQTEAEKYAFQLSEWIATQKSTLDMLAATFATNPDMVEDYEGTVTYLDRLTKEYRGISASYIANPEFDPCVYVNSGWKPDPDWHVEERPWYIELMNSGSDWYISAPYYDVLTDQYCVTFAKKVYNAKTGEFIGNCGIDFIMDDLVEILGSSYSDQGYAFLVDTAGNIINHPYGSYQMSSEVQTNVGDLPYGSVKVDGKTTLMFKDYDDRLKIVVAVRNSMSKFTVYAVADAWNIYGRVVVYGIFCLVFFLSCIILVYRLLSGLIRWQDETNRKMKDAADTAIAAGQAKSRFLAQMSHEIRTPINAVLGMNEMILRESGDKQILEYADNIQAAGKNLLSLINSILDFSKIEDGKMEILSVRYEPASLIHNLVNSISERAKQKSLDLVVDVDENIPSVLYGDDVRITQVILNLLSNAVKYTERGRVTLSVKEEDRSGDEVVLCVRVSDTGIGIRKEDMGRLFESFERLEEKRNRNIEGTGLGMAIVTKLLDMMDSKLYVESVYGVGSEFFFRIRQGIADARPMGSYERRISGSRREEREKKHLYAPDASVLVVDDNEMNRKVARNLMKMYGFVADLASSGEEAIAMIMAKHYHIVFLDHMMPRMDGIETLEKLRYERLLPGDTAVVVLTANAVVGAKEQYMEAGFDDYLSKPIEVSQLEGKLVRFLPGALIRWKEEAGDRSRKEEKPKKTEKQAAAAEEEGKTPESGDAVFEFEPQEEGGPLEFGPEGDGPLEFGPAGGSGEESGDRVSRCMERLREEGLNVEDGVRFCADAEFYIEMAEDYVRSAADRMAELDALWKEQDWKGYRTLVHALKSSSKTIGAAELAEEAKRLEDAAKEEDGIYLQEHHEEFLQAFEKLTEKMGKALS